MIEPKLDPFLALCRHCDAQIVWANGPDHQRIPFDVNPEAVHEEGNWALDLYQPPYLREMRPPDKVLKASQPTQGQAAGMRAAGLRLYSHHALHCPRVKAWYDPRQHGPATRRARGGRR